MKKNKTVYVPMAVDILHEGHINIINIDAILIIWRQIGGASIQNQPRLG